MKVALVACGLLVCSGCVRSSETMVREQAASAFACADYALRIVEVGPDVYRASGCGQELIYACAPSKPTHEEQTAEEPGDDAVMVCSRKTE